MTIAGLHFEYRREALRMVTPFENSLMRAKFSEIHRHDFRVYAEHMCRCHLREANAYQIHHIVPLLFGGTNEKHNLALVSYEVHRAIHDFIANQTGGMEPGDVREVNIPYLAGKIWPQPRGVH